MSPEPSLTSSANATHGQTDTTDTKLALLRRFPLLKDLPNPELEPLAKDAIRLKREAVPYDKRVVVKDSAGNVTQSPDPNLLFVDGQEDDYVYFIVSGEVEIFLVNAAEMEIHLETLGSGGIFGEVAVLHERKRTASARVVQDLDALIVPGKTLRPHLEHAPQLLLGLFKEATRRLGRTSQDLRKTTVRDANKIFREELSPWENRLDRVATFCGSIQMVIANLILLGLWTVICNVLGRSSIDHKQFNVLTLLVSVEAIVITCLVLHSQRLREKHETAIADEETRANLNTERMTLQLDERVRGLQFELNRRLSDIDRAITPASRSDLNSRDGKSKP